MGTFSKITPIDPFDTTTYRNINTVDQYSSTLGHTMIHTVIELTLEQSASGRECRST